MPFNVTFIPPIENGYENPTNDSELKFSGSTVDECLDYLDKEVGNVSKLDVRADWYNEPKNDITKLDKNNEIFNAWIWMRKNIARKIFHPGNSLSIAFILIALGLVLGIACPPALLFTALSFAVFSAVSAVIYAIDWFKRDYNVYQGKPEFKDNLSITSYIKNCLARLRVWALNHPIQATLMGLGAVLFLGALIITAGYFIAPAVFAFMTAGTLGGAIGLTTSFFGAAGVLSPIVASVLAGVTLVLGPVNILDSMRRLGSGIYKIYTETKEQISGTYVINYVNDRKREPSMEGNPAAPAPSVTIIEESPKRSEFLMAEDEILIGDPSNHWWAKNCLEGAKKGDATEQASLGFCYETGDGIQKNLQKAIYWYEKSVAQNNMRGQYRLACCYEEGIGVEQDLSEAVRYYDLAANQGHELSAKNLADLLKKDPDLKSDLPTYTPGSPLSSPASSTQPDNGTENAQPSTKRLD